MKSSATGESTLALLVTTLNGRETLYEPLLTFSAVASAPSIFTALTVSSREPSEIYPMASASLATVVFITAVELVIAAEEVVLSTFLPLPSFSSIPNSSINAPRVPDPSSREVTLMGASFDSLLESLLLALQPTSNPHKAAKQSANAPIRTLFLTVLTFKFLLSLG